MSPWTYAIDTFLTWLGRNSLQACLLIGLILALQALLRDRISPRWRYALWLILVAKLALPWSPPSRLSVYNLLPYAATRTRTAPADLADVSLIPPPVAPATDPAVNTPSAVVLTPAAAPHSTEPTSQQRLRAGLTLPSLIDLLPIVWLAGALLMVLATILQALRLGAVRRQRFVTDQAALTLLEDCKQQMGVPAFLALVESPHVASPALFGFLRPRLLLPPGSITSLGPTRLRHVFLHELAHLKRRDIPVNWLLAVLQTLHWFNPLVWYAFARMRADRELACDALALSPAGAPDPRDYGRTIVDMLETFVQPRRQPNLAGILEGKSQLKRRITMIARFSKTSRPWSLPAAALLVLVAGVALTGAQSPLLPPVTITAADIQLLPDSNPQTGTYFVVATLHNPTDETVEPFDVRFYRGAPAQPNALLGLHSAGPIKPADTWRERSRDLALREGTNTFTVVLGSRDRPLADVPPEHLASLRVEVKDGRIAATSAGTRPADLTEPFATENTPLPSNISQLRVRLTRAAADGAPVPHVGVTLWHDNGGSGQRDRTGATTDARGTALLQVAPGKGRLQIILPSGLKYTRDLELRGGQRLDLSLICPTGARSDHEGRVRPTFPQLQGPDDLGFLISVSFAPQPQDPMPDGTVWSATGDYAVLTTTGKFVSNSRGEKDLLAGGSHGFPIKMLDARQDTFELSPSRYRAYDVKLYRLHSRQLDLPGIVDSRQLEAYLRYDIVAGFSFPKDAGPEMDVRPDAQAVWSIDLPDSILRIVRQGLPPETTSSRTPGTAGTQSAGVTATAQSGPVRSTIPDDVALLRVCVTSDRPDASCAGYISISILPGTAQPPEQGWTQGTGTTDNAGQVLVQRQPGSYWLRMYGSNAFNNKFPFASNWIKIDLQGGREQSLSYVCPSDFCRPTTGHAAFAIQPELAKADPGYLVGCAISRSVASKEIQGVTWTDSHIQEVPLLTLAGELRGSTGTPVVWLNLNSRSSTGRDLPAGHYRMDSLSLCYIPQRDRQRQSVQAKPLLQRDFPSDQAPAFDITGNAVTDVKITLPPEFVAAIQKPAPESGQPSQAAP